MKSVGQSHEVFLVNKNDIIREAMWTYILLFSPDLTS